MLRPRAKRDVSAGYAVLTTSILQALCQARGLDTTGDRGQLLARLETGGTRPRHRRDRGAESRMEPRRATARAETAPCAVARVLAETTQLARGVVDLQREVARSKRSLAASGSGASARLEEILSAGTKRPREPLELAPQCE